MVDIKNNKFMNSFFIIRSYFDIGMNVISYVTGKFPMIAGLIIILQFLEIPIEKKYLWVFVIASLIIIVIVGFFYQKSGLYHLEWEKMTNLNPVNNEIYQAALKINGRDKK